MGCMSGLNSCSLQFDTAAIPATTTRRAEEKISQMTTEDATSVLMKGGILESTEESSLEPDYDVLQPLLSNPAVFCNAEGECPVHMSDKQWIQIILARGGNNDRPDFVLSECDRQYRHDTYKQSFIQLKMTPKLVESIGAIPHSAVSEASQLLRQNYGPPRSKALQTCSASVKAMFEGVKFAGSRLWGTPQSYSSLMSKAGTGATALWGEWTGFITICMSEAHSQIAFDIMGQFTEFNLEATVNTANHPSMTRLKQALVNHPAAISQFADLIVHGFHAEYLGWPIGSKYQLNPDCLAGPIAAIGDKFETSGRQGGKHDHLLMKQTTSNARQLKKVIQKIHRSHSKSKFFTYLKYEYKSNVLFYADLAR